MHLEIGLLKLKNLFWIPLLYKCIKTSAIHYHLPLKPIKFNFSDMSPALEYYTRSSFSSQDDRCQQFVDHHHARTLTAIKRDVYDNPRLDPKRFLDGPLSDNPATRLRQMLARPGIVVRTSSHSILYSLTALIKVAPGICDGISARCALEAGFSCLYQRQIPIHPCYGKILNDMFSVVQRRLPRD